MILSHRGYWKHEKEKNTLEAFERSFSLGFGTETDIRDLNGELVISHDTPTGEEIKVSDFLLLFNDFDPQLLLALNIKSDGLQSKLLELLDKFNISNYFVFDMSVPDALGYLKAEINAFTRHSEYEYSPSFLDEAKGVWMDEFKGHWIKEENIKEYLALGKQVCIVSPELHKRGHMEEWQYYRNHFSFVNNPKLHICTDLPETARAFFK